MQNEHIQYKGVSYLPKLHGPVSHSMCAKTFVDSHRVVAILEKIMAIEGAISFDLKTFRG